MNYALINDGIVVNVMVWDGETPLDLPDGVSAAPLGDSGAWIGWSYDGAAFAPPMPPAEEPAQG